MVVTSSSHNVARARITRQGQITVPKQVRDALGVGPGDVLEFEVSEGRAVVNPRPRRSILDFAGIAGSRSPRLPRTAHDLDRLIETAGRERAETRLKRSAG